MGDGVLAALLVAHGLAQAVAHAAADRRVHRAAGHQAAQHHGLVLALHVVPGQHFHQRGHRGQGPGHHHQAGGVLVQPVHDAGARQFGQLRVVVQQGVEQGAGGVARAGVHHQAGRLVEHQQVLVLVHDGERDGLRRAFHLGFQLGLQPHQLAAAQQLAGRHRGAVQRGRAGLDPRGEARARIVGEQLGQRLVEPASGRGQRHPGFVAYRGHAPAPAARRAAGRGAAPVSAIMPFRSNI